MVIEAERQSWTDHVNRIRRFRILIMGRANSGKTSVLQRICNTTDQPEIFDGEGRKICGIHGNFLCFFNVIGYVQVDPSHGHHDIENELVFKSNPHFVFHDSCGFEASSISAFNQMKEFVMDHARTPKLEMYCIPLSDTTRMVTATERKFFDGCDTGHEVDWAQVAEVQKRILDENLAKIKRYLNVFRFQPFGFLPLTGKCSIIALTYMHKEGADCTALLKCTTNALNEENLQMLLILTQQSNLTLCIEFTVMK
ncbi:hypothetical protein F5J12DRAFT_902407 [Pisolithus orientalis]|uniref:uncharacterized protein n=1 Tax=Pisolithus orientalis TaxID=936130 RepID=UPI0022252E44|nr:uncharacterized protein F5J12DRAFT_902407 [Pisolithus orientalis]KAI6035642.1 hypothetical protein F5J12DRAFT_902407 [Pisolithus orientalis]